MDTKLKVGPAGEGGLTNVRSFRIRVAGALFVVISVLMGLDIVADAASGSRLWHLVGELVVAVVAVAGVVLLWMEWRAAEDRVDRLTGDLGAAREEAARFRVEAREALAGLGEAIDRQFDRWHLSVAEKEVGWLLLKGLSHREVADVRSTSEATVRQQALALYRKANLRSRADLAAFFLEDLMGPQERPSPTLPSSSAPPRT